MQDRGTKKWTSLMLPEHVEMIKQLWAEDDFEQRPILSDQQLEENEFLLQEALENDSIVQIKYFNNHNFCFIQGRIITANKHLIINDITLDLDDILEIKMV